MLERAAIADRLPTVRSALSNGTRMHPKGVDGRSTTARRFKDIVVSLAESSGGEAALNEAEKALIRNAAAMVLRSERLQADSVSGRDVDSAELTRLANASARLLSALRRKPKAAGPSISPLHAYLAQKDKT
jgi:hypothetical protein